MDSKQYSQPNNGVDSGAGLKKSQSKNTNNANSDSKQMSSTNSTEPKRIIKQIVSLDSKKLKALGLESNILSALTKFNGTEKLVVQRKPTETVKNVPPPSTSSVVVKRVSTECPVQKPPLPTPHSPVKPIIAIQNISPSKCKSPESTKKIHVLSNVLLNENKLDLKEFTAIASSTPVNRSNLSYVSQVPRPSQIKLVRRIEVDAVSASQTVSSPSVVVKNDPEPIKTHKSPIKLPESHPPSSPTKADTLKGFSQLDLKCSLNQFEHLQNEIHLPTPTSGQVVPDAHDIVSLRNKSEDESNEAPSSDTNIDSEANIMKIENDTDQRAETETLNETSFQSSLSSTFTTSDTVSSSESSSEEESDLEELIREAKLIIENEQSDDLDVIEEELPTVIKKPRLIKKELLDLLAEHVDKDRLIDDFLDSTINSFRTECVSPSDSDSSVENTCNATEEDRNESTGSITSDESQINTTFIDAVEDCVSNVIVKESDESSAKVPKSRKRKISDKQEPEQLPKVFAKRKNLQSISKVKSDNNLLETQQSTTNPSSTVKIEKTEPSPEQPTEISQGRRLSFEIGHTEINNIRTNLNCSPLIETTISVETSSSAPLAGQETSIEDAVLPKSTKRGRKPKQSILSDYFTVQNTNPTETKASSDDTSNDTNNASMRSSRYGRVIKPKSLDIKSNKKLKPEHKPGKELTESSVEMATVIETEINPPIAVVKPLKKRGRRKISDSIAQSTVNTPATESDSDAINKSIETPTKLNQSPDNSIAFELLAARRKSTERLLVPVDKFLIDSATEYSTEKISIQQIDENSEIFREVTPKRRGRPKKSSLKNSNETNIQPIQIECETPSNEIIVDTTDDEIMSVSKSMPNKKDRKRGGRRQKNATEDVSIETPPLTNLLASSSDQPLSTTSQTCASETETSAQSGQDDSISMPKKRGRPRKSAATEIETNPDEPKITCGNCQQEIPQSKWKVHEGTHIGVTYRVGIDEPIDVDDAQTQSRIMIRYMKHNKIQYLKCIKCGERKKSAVGYISHVEVCGLTNEEVKTMKAECEYCKKLYRKVSLASHQQSFCTVRRLELAQQQADQLVKSAQETPPVEEGEEIIYSESGRPKRKIKKVKITSKPVDMFIKVGLKITGGTFKNWTNQLKEENIIKCSNHNCSFTTIDLAEMRTHYRQCRDSIHQCRICSTVEHSRDDIVQHIESAHADELKLSDSEDDDTNGDGDFKATHSSSDEDYEDDDCSNDDYERTGKKTFKSLKRKRTIPLKRIMEEEAPALWDMVQLFYTQILNAQSGYYQRTYQWTKHFNEENYDRNVLALKDHLRDQFDHVRLPQRELNKFIGLLKYKSAQFSYQKQTVYQVEKFALTGNEAWHELNLFESVKCAHIKTESAVIFCGGKIITADWIPFPADYTGNQVLVICSQNKGAKPLNATNRFPAEKCKNLIQLWSVSTKTSTEIDATEFMYGIAYEDGPICTICFCPSDAYVATKRLAIAAVPETSGNINIISLPDNITNTKNNMPTVIKVKPEIRLQIGLKKGEIAPQTVTQIAWSRTKGHTILCAGYNTGLVAVWNFDHLNSSYMCKKDNFDGIPVLIPQYTFVGALSFVTQLDLHPNSDGRIRWILVGALDRRIRLYDLHDPQLTPFTSQIFKSRIISGAWPVHWPMYLTIIDAALTRTNGGLHIKHVLYTDNQPRSTYLFNDCEPSNLAFSDWLNTAIYGNSAGDLFMINFQQLLLHDRFDECLMQKVLSCTDFFQDDPVVSDETEDNDRIRILFNDFDDTIYAPKMNTRISPIDQCPFDRITRVAINPNESHQKLYAIGYELGFCRIHFMP